MTIKRPLYHYQGSTAYIRADDVALRIDRALKEGRQYGAALRLSVSNDDLVSWYEVGWSYIMPDFDNADHSIIEWQHDKPPVQPLKENQHERART